MSWDNEIACGKVVVTVRGERTGNHENISNKNKKLKYLANENSHINISWEIKKDERKILLWILNENHP